MTTEKNARTSTHPTADCGLIPRKKIRLSGARYEQPVGKRFDLGKDGALIKTVIGKRSQPAELLNLQFETAAEGLKFIEETGPETIFFAGTFEGSLETGTIVSKGVLAGAMNAFSPDDLPDLVSATKEHLSFREGPAIATIDMDKKRADQVTALWPEVPNDCLSPHEVRAALIELAPELADCPMLVLPSSSSMLQNKNTAEIVSGPGGWHVHIVVNDGRKVPHLLESLHLRAWGRGRHCFAFVSRAGATHFRSLADQALGRPTQPVFVAPDLCEALTYAPGGMLTINLEGDFLDVDAVLLTEADRIAAARNMKAAAATLEPHAKTVKGAIKRAKIAELTGRGVAADTAAHAAHLRYDRMMLAGSDTVIFEDGIVVTVGDLLGPKGADFDGKLCLDPVEPDYDGGRAVGKFFWNSGRGPVVHSFAHGSTTYRLAHDDQSIFAAIEAGGADHARLVAALANAEVNSIVAAQAETAVAKALGLGTKRQQLQEEVAKVRSKIARHSGETEPVPLIDVAFDQRLPPSGFPFVRHEPKRVVILDHREDVRHLTRAYGVMPAYNLISKEIGCVGVDEGSGDNKGSALFSLMRSLCALNEVPTENFDAHFLALADENARNPVTDYLKPLPWDGAPRFDKLAAVMGPRDPEVARIAVRIALLQAVAAADHASIARGLDTETRAHFESIIVFQGGQGLGKTKGLRRWLPRALRQYMKEGQVLDLRNKDSHKLAVSCWICELGELEATFKKSDIAALKAFVSKDMDEIRLPYARAASTFLRRTAFFASVNEEHFLSDPTGNRRFVPLAVTQVDPGWSDDEIDQLWAEAWHRYTAGERWWPTKDEEPVLAANAERYRAVLPIEEKLDQRYDWGKPASGTRRTAIQVCSDLDDPVPGPSTVKAIQAALRRLWLASGLAEFRDGDLWTTDQNGSARRVNSSGGKKPGWLLPPRRPAETMAQAGQTIPPRLSLVGSGSDVAVPAVKTYPLPPAPSPRG